MPFGSGVCPRCGTCNSVLRGVMAPSLRAHGDVVQRAPKGGNPAAHIVFWTCWRCGRQFQTEAMVQ
jgi:uncharacterized protein with PIN domain